MTMVSTRDLSKLPDLAGFKRLTQSLAMLDAILSPEWEHRYYSFNAAWSEAEMMASMRNGCGDHWFALLGPAGVALHGLAHESPLFNEGTPPPWVFAGLPADFHASFLREAAFETQHSTFCIWRRASDAVWQCGTPPAGENAEDGSAELLELLAGDPVQYVEFATDYYECEIDAAAVEAIYRHTPLTRDLVLRLNPDADYEALNEDRVEIAYPSAD
jgi:hypothetical protein